MYVQNLRIAIGQINPSVGEIEKNLSKVVNACSKSHSEGANILLFGELALSGYPIGDLALRRDFLETCDQAIQRLVGESANWPGLHIVVGFPRVSTNLDTHD